MSVYVELDEKIERIEVSFRYTQERHAKIKQVQGRHFDWDTKIWTVPLELTTARKLRKLFGDEMELGPAFRKWAKQQVLVERNMRSFHSATDAKLEHTPKVILDAIAGKPMDFPDLPLNHALRKRRPERPYQRADIRMMSTASCMNCNDVGTGKTLEAIGAIFEAQMDTLPVLIVAPRRSLVSVWQTEFARYAPKYDLLTSEDPGERKKAMREFVECIKDGESTVAIALIADDLRLEKYRDVKDASITEEDELHAARDYRGCWYRYRSQLQKELFEVGYGYFFIDEFHKTGINNRRSLFFVSASKINARFKTPMSATPMGGKPRRLWPVLNFLDKKQYSSEWRWIDNWLEVTEDEVYVKGGAKRTVKNVGGLDPDNEAAFYDHHKMHMTRRTKKDALPGLPDAVEILVETPMWKEQEAAYRKFDNEHEILLDGERLSGSIVLAQYTRLRQLATAKLKRSDGKWVATMTSGKLESLIERLDENGIRSTDYEPGARAYIGCLEVGMVDVVAKALSEKNIAVATLTGKTKDSNKIVKRFNDGTEPPFVIVMTIQTGGTALNLESAGSAHAIDEMWDPDEMHQFFGRGDRGSRDTALKCYTYRTPDTIQEYIAKVAWDKKVTNSTVLNMVKEIENMRRAA